jgi:hypothetical protein
MMILADASSSIITGAGQACGSSCNTASTIPGTIKTIGNVLVFLVGSISVIMIIIGGFRYVTSGGDSKAVSAAKDTILYAIIGVVVAIVAYAIVQFVATNVK